MPDKADIPVILCVDDEFDQLAVIQKALEDISCSFLTASSAHEALEILNKQSVDLVLTDLSMPGRSGLELLEDVRASYSGIEVVIFTGHGDIESAVKAMRLGAADFIAKPFTLQDLKVRVEKALHYRQLRSENNQLKEAVRSRGGLQGMVGASPAMNDLRKFIDRVCDSMETVLIQGESGTGKELVARALHESSQRSSEPFIVLDCASLPAQVIESELFGHVKGAFTGADRNKQGLMKVVGYGTLFLDELGELPLDCQAKFLRALQEREARPVGGHEAFKIHARVIAATNRDLLKEVEGGRFREDLFHRLNVLPLQVPPLRKRLEDLDRLVEHFINEISARGGRQVTKVSSKARARLQEYHWPGNIRELRNVISRCLTLGEGVELELTELNFLGSRQQQAHAPKGSVRTLKEVQLEAIQVAVNQCEGNVREAAKLLGISKSTLYTWLNKFDLKTV